MLLLTIDLQQVIIVFVPFFVTFFRIFFRLGERVNFLEVIQ